MAQQTAVEWLIEQLVELDKQLDGRRKSDDSTVIKFNPTKIYEQAKQMEKEQILEAYFEGFREGRGIDKIDISGKIFYEDTNAERYYNITYQPNENHFPKEI